MLVYENPFSKYIVLESVSNNASKNIYIVNLDSEKEQFKIGRGHDNDIRISDISVSRFHATITKNEHKELILNDK